MPIFDVSLMGIIHVEVEVQREEDALEAAVRRVKSQSDKYTPKAEWLLNELEDDPIREVRP